MSPPWTQNKPNISYKKTSKDLRFKLDEEEIMAGTNVSLREGGSCHCLNKTKEIMKRSELVL